MTEFATLPIDTARRRQENALHDQLFPSFVDYYSAHVRNYALAKELARVAIGKVMTKLDTFDQSKPLENWAIRVARNYLYDYYRQKASAKHQLVQVRSAQYDVWGEGGECNASLESFGVAQSESDQEYQLLESELLAQLAAWPGDEGVMVRLHLLEGREAKEIAASQGFAEKRVKAVLAEAKILLQTQLQGGLVEAA